MSNNTYLLVAIRCADGRYRLDWKPDRQDLNGAQPLVRGLSQRAVVEIIQRYFEHRFTEETLGELRASLEARERVQDAGLLEEGPHA
jgi:hypothetical protein